MDIGVIFGVEALEFRVEGLVAGAGQAGVSVVDLDVGIPHLEVGHVVVAGEPGRHGIGDLICLGLEAGALDEAAEGFGVAEVFLEGRGWSQACTQFPFVITTGDVGHLPGALVLYSSEYILIMESDLRSCGPGHLTVWANKRISK